MSDPFGELPARHYILLWVACLDGAPITQEHIETLAAAENVTPTYVRRVITGNGYVVAKAATGNGA